MIIDNPGLFIVIGAIGIFFGFFRWKTALLSIFVLITFEGAIRKYVFYGAGLEIYLIKDFVITGIYLHFVYKWLNHKWFIKKSPLILPVALFFLWALVTAVIHYQDNQLVTLVGLHNLIFYVPLIFVGKELFKNKTSTTKVFILLLLLGSFASVFAIAQFIQGPYGSLNREYEFGYIPAFVSLGAFRPSSTFNHTGTFGQFIFATSVIGMFLLNQKFRSKRMMFLTISLAAINVVGLIVSGQRSGWFLIFGGFIVSLWSQQKIGKIIGSSLRLIFFIGVIIVVIWYYFPQAIFYLIGRSMHAITNEEFIGFFMSHDYVAIFNTDLFSFFLGHGLGSSSLGRRYILGDLKLNPIVEAGYAKLIWEIGFIGFLITLWFQYKSLKLGLRLWNKTFDKYEKNIILCLLMIIIGYWIWNIRSTLLDNANSLILIYIFIGFLVGVADRQILKHHFLS